MADDDKLVDKLWYHLDERLDYLVKDRLSEDRLKKIIIDAIFESNTIQKILSRTEKV